MMRSWLDARAVAVMFVLLGSSAVVAQEQPKAEPFEGARSATKGSTAERATDEPLPAARPLPATTLTPLPDDRVSIAHERRELTQIHFGAELRRPFLFPIIGPTGDSLTRLGHPHDPHGHSHHNSVWISHHDVGGVSFWSDRGKESGQIKLERMVRYDDAADIAKANQAPSAQRVRDEGALVEAFFLWSGAEGKTLLREQRIVRVYPLDEREWLLVIDLVLQPTADPVTLGKTPFGLLGVRMAKSIGVLDGGGRILSSEGKRGEAEVLWQRARWVDYAGPITDDETAGITLLDHPSNPNHPTYFHVRGDGWMGTSLTFDAPRTIERDTPLALRYGLYVHRGVLKAEVIEQAFARFAKIEAPLPPPSSK